jgi:putative phage-type endonuclease
MLPRVLQLWGVLVNALELNTRAEWLAARRHYLTASDVAAVLGLSPFGSPLSVYAAKVAGVELEETPWMRRGRRMEAVVADEYGEVTGRPVIHPGPYVLMVHPDIPWLAATLDRQTAGSEQHPAPEAGYAPLEIKAPRDAHGWEDDKAPIHYELQLQIQIACTVARWGVLCALLGQDADAPVVRDRLPHPRAMAGVLPQLEEFWSRVQRQDPPPVLALPGEDDAVRALWAEETGATEELDGEALEVTERWAKAKARASEAEREAKELGTWLRARLRDSSFGRLPDGSYLTLRTEARGAHVVKASSPRVLRRVWKFKNTRRTGR